MQARLRRVRSLQSLLHRLVGTALSSSTTGAATSGVDAEV
jgi:hypothetical protein